MTIDGLHMYLVKVAVSKPIDAHFNVFLLTMLVLQCLNLLSNREGNAVIFTSKIPAFAHIFAYIISTASLKASRACQTMVNGRSIMVTRLLINLKIHTLLDMFAVDENEIVSGYKEQYKFII